MKPWPIPRLLAPGACAGSSSVTMTPARNGRASGERANAKRWTALRPNTVTLVLATLLLAACSAGTSVTVSDTYCRDTFFWRTSARDTEETRKQADLHNSRRLCRCNKDCAE